MSYIDLSFLDKQIERYGEDIDLIIYSNEEYSEQGDLVTQTSTIEDIRAIFNTYGQDARYFPETQFGEIRFSFFFKGNQDGIETDNLIQRANGERWKIKKTLKHSLSGTNTVQEAIVSNN